MLYFTIKMKNAKFYYNQNIFSSFIYGFPDEINFMNVSVNGEFAFENSFKLKYQYFMFFFTN